MGNRYGMHRPLVVDYSLSDFEILLSEARALKLEDVELLQTWYLKDDNAVPPTYSLQVFTSLWIQIEMN